MSHVTIQDEGSVSRRYSAEAAYATTTWERDGDTKPYIAFLTHCKAEAGSVARNMKAIMRHMLPDFDGRHACYLDSDNLSDLFQLFREGVSRSEVVMVLATANTFTRPWCLAEIYCASKLAIPVVLVTVDNGGFDADRTRALLQADDFRERLEAANPGGYKDLVNVLRRYKIIDPTKPDAAFRATVLEAVGLSGGGNDLTSSGQARLRFSPNDSRNAIQADLIDIFGELARRTGRPPRNWRGKGSELATPPVTPNPQGGPMAQAVTSRPSREPTPSMPLPRHSASFSEAALAEHSNASDDSKRRRSWPWGAAGAAAAGMRPESSREGGARTEISWRGQRLASSVVRQIATSVRRGSSSSEGAATTVVNLGGIKLSSEPTHIVLCHEGTECSREIASCLSEALCAFRSNITTTNDEAALGLASGTRGSSDATDDGGSGGGGASEASDLICRAHALVVILTEGVLTKPRCLALLCLARRADILIVPVYVEGGGYDYMAAKGFLSDLEASLTTANCTALARALAEFNAQPAALAAAAASREPRCEMTVNVLGQEMAIVIPSLIAIKVRRGGDGASATHYNGVVKDVMDRIAAFSTPGEAPGNTLRETSIGSRCSTTIDEALRLAMDQSRH